METKDFSANNFNDMRDPSHFNLDPRTVIPSMSLDVLSSHLDSTHLNTHIDPYSQRYYVAQGNLNTINPSRMDQQNYMVPQMPMSSTSMLQMYSRVPLPSQIVEDEPIYVNAKQFQRILKRRQARQKYDQEHEKADKRKEPYMHKSRHDHAKRRARGPGGRFLSKRDIEASKRGEYASPEDSIKNMSSIVNSDAPLAVNQEVPVVHDPELSIPSAPAMASSMEGSLPPMGGNLPNNDVSVSMKGAEPNQSSAAAQSAAVSGKSDEERGSTTVGQSAAIHALPKGNAGMEDNPTTEAAGQTGAASDYYYNEQQAIPKDTLSGSVDI